MTHSPSIFNTIFYSTTRILILVFLIYKLGYLYGIIATTFVFWSFSFLVKLIFGLERLSSGDRYFLNSDDSVFTIMVGGVFEIENFDEDKLRKHIIERVYKKIKKVSAKVVEILGDYFYTYSHIQVSENEKIKLWNERIINVSCKKSEVDKKLQDLLNLPMNIFKNICFEFYLIKYTDSSDGTLFIKLHHSLSDGLSMVNLIGFIDDEMEISKFPLILRKSPSFLESIKRNIYEFILGYTIGILQVFIFSKDEKPELFESKDINGPEFNKRDVLLSQPISCELSKIKNFSKTNGITVNEIGLGIVSYAFKKAFPNKESASIYVPFGSKGLENTIDRLVLENGAESIKINLKLTENFEGKNKEDFIKTIRQSLKKTYLKKVFSVVIYIIVNYFGQRTFNSVKSSNLGDLIVSNVPCQEKIMTFAGCKVKNVYPISNAGSNLGFITICSYVNTVNFCISLKKTSNVDVNLISFYMKEKIERLFYDKKE